MVDKTLEAFGLTREEMKEANQQAADQMLPIPYDIPGEVGPTKTTESKLNLSQFIPPNLRQSLSEAGALGYQLADNVIGIDDDYDTSGELLARALQEDPVNTIKGVATGVVDSVKAAYDDPRGALSDLGNEFVNAYEMLSTPMDPNASRDEVGQRLEAATLLSAVVPGAQLAAGGARAVTSAGARATPSLLDAMPEYDPNTLYSLGGIGSNRPSVGSPSSAMPTEGIRVFHASPQEIEGEFRLSNTDVGLHFANNPNLAENAAVKSAFERPSAAENIRSQEFVINAKPEQIVDIPASANRFDFYDVLDSLYENGRIDQGLFNEIFDGLESIEDLSTTGASMLQEQNKFFADSLSRNTDIRALRYMNEFDAGPTWRDFEQGQTTSSVTPDYSYIVLDPKFVTRPTNPPDNSGVGSSSSLSAPEPATVIPVRNANLENWSENAYFKDAEGLPQQLYHGMSGNLRGQPVEFSGENLEPSYMGTLGPGTYLTRDPSVASDFATSKRAGYTDEKFGGQVIPVYTNVTKVVDDNVINSNKELRTEIADLIEENTDDNYLFNLADKLRSEDDINLSSLFTKTEDGKVRSTGVGSLVSSLLESKGYEGISVVTDKGFHEAVIFPGHGGVEFPRQNIKSSLQGPEGQYSRETNDMRFNEGGLAMERQMNTMMAEGGIKDSGMNRDPISGNEIPAGSLAKEVRDDVDAKLSEGEYVVPADVVRFFGVNYFEKLRQKAKAGLEEMDKDGRIGGDPVPMDDDFPFSDEELMSVGDEPIAMNEGGAVSAFNPAAFQPGGFGASSGSGQSLPTETKTYINANGEIRSILFINGQPIQQIPSGFLEDTPENRAKLAEGKATPDSSVESTSSKDRDRSVQTTQSTGEKKSGYSLDEDQLKSLDEDPAAFGQAALKGDIFTGKNLGTLGMAINPALGLLGVAAGTYNEMRNIAGARSALEVMKSRELTDTPEYRQLASDLKAKEGNLGLAAKGLDSIMDFSGKTGAASLIKSDPAPMTPQAIPTVNPKDSSSSAGMTYAPAVNPLVGKSGSEMLPSSSKSSTKTTTTKKSTPSGASSAAKAKIDAGSTGYSSAPKKETTEQKLKRGGGFASGGLVQRPKKKPVAKK